MLLSEKFSDILLLFDELLKALLNEEKEDSLTNENLLLTFFKFHFERSGILINLEHPPKSSSISSIFSTFHLEISGIDNKFEQPLNIYLILKTFFVFHFDKSGNVVIEEQS